MKINAVIESKDGGTLVLDFPRSIYDVYEKLQSVGIIKSPHQITLSDEEGDDVRVKLYSEDEVGKHLLLTLNEQNSLADANMLAFMVDNAKSVREASNYVLFNFEAPLDQSEAVQAQRAANGSVYYSRYGQ